MQFEVVVPEVEEIGRGEPEEVVLENARLKARAGLRQLGEEEGIVVLGVDTDVVLDRVLLGKPANEAEARERLEALSGRTHEVLSGVALLGAGAFFADSANEARLAAELDERAGIARSQVTFRDLDEETISLYLRSGEWRDRAGGYAIQGLGAILIERLQGDFSNVVGLPVALLLELAPELSPGPKRV